MGMIGEPEQDQHSSCLSCTPDSSAGWRVAARLISAPHSFRRRRSLMLRDIGTTLPDTWRSMSGRWAPARVARKRCQKLIELSSLTYSAVPPLSQS